MDGWTGREAAGAAGEGELVSDKHEVKLLRETPFANAESNLGGKRRDDRIQ